MSSDIRKNFVKVVRLLYFGNLSSTSGSGSRNFLKDSYNNPRYGSVSSALCVLQSVDESVNDTAPVRQRNSGELNA